MISKGKIKRASVKNYTPVFRENLRFSPKVTGNLVETKMIMKVHLFRMLKMYVKELRLCGARGRSFRLDNLVYQPLPSSQTQLLCNCKS